MCTCEQKAHGPVTTTANIVVISQFYIIIKTNGFPINTFKEKIPNSGLIIGIQSLALTLIMQCNCLGCNCMHYFLTRYSVLLLLLQQMTGQHFFLSNSI